MAPIRVGLIGLPGTPPDKYEGVSWTANAHLPYLLASPNHEIVALLNSSAESAKIAIKRHNLPATTKAYGNPEDLAADPNVDLVVCSVRVDRHFQTVRPSIIAGKAVFVEWPLERNLALAKEMTALATKHNVRTVVGIQGSFSSVVRKMKEVLDSGKIGKLLSSTVFGSLGIAGPTEVKDVRYFLDRKVGGNALSIHWGHGIETFTSVLGEFKSWDSLLSNRHEFKDIINPSTGKIDTPKAPNNVPDQHLLHGIVSPSNAPVSIHLRGGDPFPGTPALEWRVLGETGELRLTSSSTMLMIGRPDTKLELFDVESGKVEILVPEKGEWDELPIAAHNIAKVYEAFRKGEWVPDFAWAVKRQEMIDEMWKRYDASIEAGQDE